MKNTTIEPEPLVLTIKNKNIMALKVKAKEQFQNIGKYVNTYRYVMMPELYTALAWREPRCDAGLLGCSRRGDQGMGN